MHAPDRAWSRLWPAGFLLGFSLGGFFDGILLHQVLQWHHLLSNVRAGVLQDLRAQLLADGLFHVLMYLLAVGGLYLLWRRRDACARPDGGRTLAAWALLGFGGWHLVDALVSHWILGIHRIRVDAANPLPWDLAWLAIFGGVPLVLGWLGLHRRGPAGGPGGRATAASLAAAALIAGPLAAWPASGSEQRVVVFGPGSEGAVAFNALAAADARVLWADRAGAVWVVWLPEGAAAGALYARGALLVGASAPALGCLSWSRAGS